MSGTPTNPLTHAKVSLFLPKYWANTIASNLPALAGPALALQSTEVQTQANVAINALVTINKDFQAVPDGDTDVPTLVDAFVHGAQDVLAVITPLVPALQTGPTGLLIAVGLGVISQVVHLGASISPPMLDAHVQATAAA